MPAVRTAARNAFTLVELAIVLVIIGLLVGGQFTPAEAKAMDDKLDDGRPGKGRLMSHKYSSPGAPNCSDSDEADAAVYRTNDPPILCVLIMQTGY